MPTLQHCLPPLGMLPLLHTCSDFAVSTLSQNCGNCREQRGLAWKCWCRKVALTAVSCLGAWDRNAAAYSECRKEALPKTTVPKDWGWTHFFASSRILWENNVPPFSHTHMLHKCIISLKSERKLDRVCKTRKRKNKLIWNAANMIVIIALCYLFLLGESKQDSSFYKYAEVHIKLQSIVKTWWDPVVSFVFKNEQFPWGKLWPSSDIIFVA